MNYCSFLSIIFVFLMSLISSDKLFSWFTFIFCSIFLLDSICRVENRRTALSVLPIPATSNRAYDFPVHGFPVNFFLNHISLNRFNFRSYSTLFCNRYIILIYHITNCYSISSSHIPSFPFVSSKIFLSSSLHNLLYMRSICLNFLF